MERAEECSGGAGAKARWENKVKKQRRKTSWELNQRKKQDSLIDPSMSVGCLGKKEGTFDGFVHAFHNNYSTCLRFFEMTCPSCALIFVRSNGCNWYLWFLFNVVPIGIRPYIYACLVGRLLWKF